MNFSMSEKGGSQQKSERQIYQSLAETKLFGKKSAGERKVT